MSYILIGDSRSVAIAVSEGCAYNKFINARGKDGNRYYAKEGMGANWLNANINQIAEASKDMDCIVIKMGGNDCTNPKAVQNYIAAAEKLQKLTGKPIVFSSTDPQLDKERSAKRKAFNQRIAAECQKRGWGYINTFDYAQKEINAHPNYVKPDGVHYNSPLNGMISKYMKQHFPDVSNQISNHVVAEVSYKQTTQEIMTEDKNKSDLLAKDEESAILNGNYAMSIEEEKHKVSPDLTLIAMRNGQGR